MILSGFGAAVMEDAMIRTLGPNNLCNCVAGIGWARRRNMFLDDAEEIRLGARSLWMMWQQAVNGVPLMIVKEGLAHFVLGTHNWFAYGLIDGTGMENPCDLRDLFEVSRRTVAIFRYN